MKKRGFTLVEIMIVVGIIIILVGIAIMAGNSARAVARDNQRLTDIRLLQLKLEDYRDQNGAYPATLDQLGLTSMPQDPATHAPYQYAGLTFSGSTNCLNYHLGATLETNASALGQRAGRSNLPTPYVLCSESLNDFNATANPLIYDLASPSSFKQ
jgi:type II secretory pathway pseudopilin PulG